MSLTGSWGLVLELGDTPPDKNLQALYTSIWNDPAFTGPTFQMGQLEGSKLPRAAEGGLTLQDCGQSGKCYTKFETDHLGYPPGWIVPWTFQLSVYGFARPLPENPELYAFLLEKARAFGQRPGYRMALICELSCFYLNAEFLRPSWVDMQRESVLALRLPQTHPFARNHPGRSDGSDWQLYERNELAAFWSESNESTRFATFKRQLSESLHQPGQQLEWEGREV